MLGFIDITALLPSIVGVAAAVVALGLLIFFHEAGHFLVAKLCGVGVLKFSLGFGRKLIGKKVGETEYMVSVFPLGGYVKMLGEDEDGEDELSEEDRKRSFAAQSLGKKALIVLAGPLFNILLAVALCYTVFVTGFPTAIADVTGVVPGSPAARAGFSPGDVIMSVDGEEVGLWEEVAQYIKMNPGKKMEFTVRRGEKAHNLSAVPEEVDGEGWLGLKGAVVIGALVIGSPADKAGMEPKDRVVAVDGVNVDTWSEMAAAVREKPGGEMTFTIEREGRLMKVPVTPALKEDEEGGGETYGAVGVMMGSNTVNIRYGVVESVGLSVAKTAEYTEFIATILTRIIKGKEKASNLGGPIAIVQISGRQARQGFADFVIFMAILSVNLGVINLFPIPILDGGHLFFFGLEAVMGKPLSMRKREIAQQFGLYIIIALMVFVFYNDIARLLGFTEGFR